MGALADCYARAFLEAGGDPEALALTVRQLEEQPALWEALVSPAVQPGEKERVLSRLEGDCASPVLGLLRVMVRKDRVPLLSEASAAARRLALESGGGAVCVVTCARPLPQKQLEQIRAALCRRHHLNRVELEVRIDPGLLGGFRLELGRVTYDKSVRGGLDELARTLRERGTT